ncbi:hypothetical protein ACSSS7_005704 [Eimeria intestinalis]
MFPGLFSCTTIDWFLPWPEEALVAVSSSFLDKFEIDATPEKKTTLYTVMGEVHNKVNKICECYFRRMRRHVYVTPKSYLSFINFYKKVYTEKFDEVNNLERSVNVGLQKLNQAAQDIKQMKVQLKAEEKKLQESEVQTNQLLAQVQSESAKAEKKSQGVSTAHRVVALVELGHGLHVPVDLGKAALINAVVDPAQKHVIQVAAFRDECLRNKEEIEREQEEANNDLQAALPYLREAEDAVKSISAKDIVELKTMKTPSDIIRLVFDGVLILLQNRLVDVKPESKVINKKQIDFIHDSFDESAKAMMADVHFLSNLFDFSRAVLNEINRQFQEALASKRELEQKAQATKRRMEQANKLINGLAGEKARW